MTIHNLDAYIAALWDWGFLDECFGNTRIRVSDLDGIVERNGWFLVIEAKSPGKDIPRGQRRLFKALVNKEFSVLVIWGEANKPQHLQIWYPHRAVPEVQVKASVEDIQDIVRRWFHWANENGRSAA